MRPMGDDEVKQRVRCRIVRLTNPWYQAAGGWFVYHDCGFWIREIVLDILSWPTHVCCDGKCDGGCDK